MLVSVVMPVFNGERYLKESINSVLLQTYKHFELIIVNDGSIDGTKNILSSLHDRRINIIHLEDNCGAAHALNVGIGAARGDWIAIQDADDISLPNKLEEQVRFIKEHQDVNAVGSFIECISGDTEVPKRSLHIESTRNYLSSKEHIYAYRYYLNPFCHGSVIFSKSLFHQIGGYDPQYKICYDYDLWLRMLERTSIYKIPSVLYQYRIHADSISRNNNQTINEDWLVASKYIKKSLQEKSGREPRLIVFGLTEACEDFKKVSLINKIEVTTYFHEDFNENDILQIHQDKNADGVIFLEDIRLIHVFNKLDQKGFKLNYNLFKIWAGYYN
jgi:glycosyltransferase involved in cell wall biosynthesis